MSVTLLYRCRLCGAVEPGTVVDDVAVEGLLDELIDAPKKSARISTHVCRPGVSGVTDLCGAMVDEVVAAEAKGAP